MKIRSNSELDPTENELLDVISNAKSTHRWSREWCSASSYFWAERPLAHGGGDHERLFAPHRLQLSIGWCAREEVNEKLHAKRLRQMLAIRFLDLIERMILLSKFASLHIAPALMRSRWNSEDANYCKTFSSSLERSLRTSRAAGSRCCPVLWLIALLLYLS